jgi:hypothetical protein
MRRRRKLEVSTFPFLAVLLCAMGSLILVLLAMDRKAKLAARAKAEMAARKVAEDAELLAAARRAEWERARDEQRAAWQRKRDELHSRVEADKQNLEGQMAALRARLADSASQLRAELDGVAELERKAESEKGKIGGAARALAEKRSAVEHARAESAAQQKALEKMTADLALLENTLADLKAARERERQTYSVVPYRGKHGESRRPLYIECAANSIIFHPDKVRLSPNRVEELRAEVIRRVGQQKEIIQTSGGEPDPVPYLMLLVRPDGVPAYYQFQAALRGMEVRYGYEFIDADWLLDFPAEDKPSATWPSQPALARSDAAPSAGGPRGIKGLKPTGVPLSPDGTTGSDGRPGSGTGSGPGSRGGNGSGTGRPGGSGDGVARGTGGVPGAGGVPGGGGTGLPGTGTAGPGGNGGGGTATGGGGGGGFPGPRTGVAGLPPGPAGTNIGGIGGAPGGAGGGGAIGGPIGVRGVDYGGGRVLASSGGQGIGSGNGFGLGTGGVAGSGNGTGSGGTGPTGGMSGMVLPPIAGPGMGSGGGSVATPGGSLFGGSSQPGTNGAAGGGTGTAAGTAAGPSLGMPGDGRGAPGGTPGTAGTGSGGGTAGTGSGFSPLPPIGGTGNGTGGTGGTSGQPGAYPGGSNQPGSGPSQAANNSGGGSGATGSPYGTGGARSDGTPPSPLAGAMPRSPLPEYGSASGRPGTDVRPPPSGAAPPPPFIPGQNPPDQPAPTSPPNPPTNMQAGSGQPADPDAPPPTRRDNSRAPVGGLPRPLGPSGGGDGDGEGNPFGRYAPASVQSSPAPRKPVSLRPARLGGDRDYYIYVECRADSVVLYPSQRVYPLAVLSRGGANNPLATAVQQMIDRRQALAPPGTPPYRPQICFLVRPENMRGYHTAYPALDAIAVPKARHNLDADDDVLSIVTAH